MSDFIAAFYVVILFVVIAVGFIIYVSVSSSRRMKEKRRHLETPYRKIIDVIDRFPVYGPKDSVFFFDKERVRPRAMNYESAKHFLEDEIEKRKSERYKAFKEKGPSESSSEIIRADSASKSLWSLENEEERYKKAVRELNSWTEAYSEKISEYASDAVKQDLDNIYDIIRDAYEVGNFLSVDGDQSKNRLKDAELRLVESMEDDIGVTLWRRK